MRDSFTAMERQLKTYMAQRSREIKVHEPQPHARVTRLFPQDGYGFITTLDGRDIYFHDAAGDLRRMENHRRGHRIRFAEEMGDNGPRPQPWSASSADRPRARALGGLDDLAPHALRDLSQLIVMDAFHADGRATS